MRYTVAILFPLALAAGVRANPCWCGDVGYYVVPYYWAYPSVWGNPATNVPKVPIVPKATLREDAPPSKAADEPPRIGNPRLPTEDVEPRKELPALKVMPPKAKEKAVSVDQFLIPAEKSRALAPAEVKVGIFNHSDRDLELEINGEAVKLPADQYVTLRLPRTFTWAVKGQPEKAVTVPADSDGLEIVFRR